MRESAPLAHKPAGMSFEEAAAVCDGACIALACLQGRTLGEGTRILVYGASGSVGTAAVQLAKHFGAHVTAVCNTKNVELVRSLGADEVIDYTQEDFTKNGETYDVVFDAVGKHSFRRCRRSLKPGGIYIETDLGFLWHVPLLALLTRWIGDKRVTLGDRPKYTKEDVLFLKELIEAGEYRAVIDRRYPLEDVIEATRYVETGQKTGNVVLTVNGGQPDEGGRPTTGTARPTCSSSGRSTSRSRGRRGAGPGARGVGEPGGLVRRDGQAVRSHAPTMGLRKPKSDRVGVDFAGTVEAVGKDVTQFRPGDEVFGGGSGAFAEYVCVRETRDRAKAGEPDVRAGGGRAGGGAHRAAGSSRQGAAPAGAEGPDQRRVGRRGHVRRADRQGVRSAR